MEKPVYSREQKYLIHDIHILLFGVGLFQLLPGAVLPLIRSDYGLPYHFGGWMNALFAIGTLISGICASLPVRRLGAKRTYLLAESMSVLGLLLMLLTKNPYLLLVSMLLTGMTKGGMGYFSNQIASRISNGDTGLQNLVQAMFAGGACAAPLVAMACGTGWKRAFAVSAVIMVFALLHGLRTEIRPEMILSDEKAGDAAGSPFAFMKTKLFWLCVMMLFSYMAVEASIMGWLVTYLVDSAGAGRSTAQLISMLLWAMLLIGRFIVAAVAHYFQPWQLMSVMTAGATVSFSLLIFGGSLPVLAGASLLTGLFMAGMYGTIVSGVGSLMQSYPLCMSMMIALPGLGATLAPTVVGIAADHMGIRRAMTCLYGMVALLILTTVLYAFYCRRQKR